VENESESEVGPYDMKEATAKSVNTYYVQMISDIGICPVTEHDQQDGRRAGRRRQDPQAPSIALGTKEMSPLTMASAYATFANEGTYCTPIAIESITQKVGGQKKSLAVPKSTCSRAMSEKTADTINTVLAAWSTPARARRPASPTARAPARRVRRTSASAWFVGYTPNMAGAVWVGSAKQKRRDDQHHHRRRLRTTRSTAPTPPARSGRTP
jgi:membrane peptidoglycan carboxypeptidase